MELTILRDEESFLAIEPQWRDLSARMSSQYLFQSFDWVKPWWACHGSRKRKRLHIIHGTENGRTVLIWPLLIDSGTPWRMLRWMGADGDCADILVEDGGQAEARIQQAWRMIQEGTGYDVVLLDQVPPDARVGPFLEREIGAQADTFPSPIVTFENWSDWNEYFKSLSKNLRSNQRRRRRKLAERGEVVFETVDSLDEARAMLGWIHDTKIEWIKERGESLKRFSDINFWNFVEVVVREAHASGALYAARLRVGETVVAAELGVRYRNRLYSWLSAFDMGWANYSPGRLLLEDSMKWSFENGIEVFDFLAGPDAYKFEWTKEVVNLTTYVRPHTVWGKAYCLGVYGPFREWIKGVFHAMPKGLRDLLVTRFLVR